MATPAAISRQVIGVVLVSVLFACDSHGPGPTPTPTPSASEIWQWAVGRNIWTDPDLEPYSRFLGGTHDTDVNVQAEGFALTLDASGAVVAVELFNDESALGFPVSDSSFSAYRGQLPQNLTWAATAADLGLRYGSSNQSGGWGTEIAFNFPNPDGNHDVSITFAATHETDLPTSYIHVITVR